MIKIYRCVKTNLITQGFGIEKTNPTLISMYNSMGLKGHDGIDFGVSCKDNSAKTGGQCEMVYCDLADGADITYIQKDVKFGFGIMAIDKDGDKHIWWHFDNINPVLSVGQRIESGTLLGQAGNTGTSTGAHVHRAYYKYGENYDNGYKGASDPTPYFINIFINDVIANLEAQVGLLQKIINIIKKALNLL